MVDFSYEAKSLTVVNIVLFNSPSEDLNEKIKYLCSSEISPTLLISYMQYYKADMRSEIIVLED
jgi:hypothetical protein